MGSLDKALHVAVQAHTSQLDKSGHAYFFHPVSIARALALDGFSSDHQIVALLHDVVEDTPTTLDDLKKEGFGDKILSAVDAITKRKGESYEAYLSRVMKNPLACKVKMYDLQDNLHEKRRGVMLPHSVEKYERALEMIKKTKR